MTQPLAESCRDVEQHARDRGYSLLADLLAGMREELVALGEAPQAGSAQTGRGKFGSDHVSANPDVRLDSGGERC